MPKCHDACLFYRRFGRWQEAYSLFCARTNSIPKILRLIYCAADVSRGSAVVGGMLTESVNESQSVILDVFAPIAIDTRMFSYAGAGNIEAGNKEFEKLNLKCPIRVRLRFTSNFWNHDLPGMPQD